MKKTALFAAMLGASFVLGACSDKDDKAKEEDSAKTEQAEQGQKDNLKDQGAVDKSDTAKSDDELKEEFAKEEGVSGVSLIVTEDGGGYVLLDFDVEGDMKKERAEELADKFLKEIEKKYPDEKIDVQARKSGETFAQKSKGE